MGGFLRKIALFVPEKRFPFYGQKRGEGECMDYLKRLDDSKDELIRRLSELAAIRSVVEASEGDMPFGRGVQEAFEYFL